MPLHVMANVGGFLCECGLERSRSTWGPLSQLRTIGFGYHKRGSILLRSKTKTTTAPTSQSLELPKLLTRQHYFFVLLDLTKGLEFGSEKNRLRIEL
eukprot:Em0013g800a